MMNDNFYRSSGAAIAIRRIAEALRGVEYCVAACSGKGYAYAGLEYGSQCFCGNTLGTGSENVADSQCQVMLCPGNKGEYCSAGNRLIVYLSG